MKGEVINKYKGIIQEVMTVREIKEGKFGRFYQQKLKMVDGTIIQMTNRQEFSPKDVGKELELRNVPTPKGHSLKDGSYSKGENTPNAVVVKQINVTKSALLELSEKAAAVDNAVPLPPEMEE